MYRSTSTYPLITVRMLLLLHSICTSMSHLSTLDLRWTQWRALVFITDGLMLKLSLKAHKKYIENDLHAVTSGSDQMITDRVTETASAPTHMGFSFRFTTRQQVIKSQLRCLMALTTTIPRICLRHPLITPLKEMNPSTEPQKGGSGRKKKKHNSLK